jgi:hypothetical protein
LISAGGSEFFATWPLTGNHAAISLQEGTWIIDAGYTVPARIRVPGTARVSWSIAGGRDRIGGVARKLAADLGEELLDLGGVRDAVVVAELDLGCDAQAERAADAATQVCGDAIEAVERRGALRLGAEHADEDLGVAEVAGDLDPRDGDEADDARILDVVGEKGRDLLAHRCGDAVGSMMVRRHGSPERRRGGPGASMRPARAEP